MLIPILFFQPPFVPFFETIIRYLGGLLSAYALSKDEMLLRRAEEMVKQLDPVFNSTTGLPYYAVNPSTYVEFCEVRVSDIDRHSGVHKGSGVGVLAEIASLQVEYTYLAKLTGKYEHFNRVRYSTSFSLLLLNSYGPVSSGHEGSWGSRPQAYFWDASHTVEPNKW